MANLLSIPSELLNRIFESCDNFLQVAALASACKKAQAIWLENSRGIISRVAQSQIRSFDDALMAVRATAIVLKAEVAGNRPPVMAMDSLSGNSTLPDLDELKEVLNMQYLIRCIEHMYFFSKERHVNEQRVNHFRAMKYGQFPSTRRRFPECLQEGIPGAEDATIDSFRDLFYRAMYRLLIAGAVLAGAYLDPLFRAREEENDGFHLRHGYNWYEYGTIKKAMTIDDSELGDHNKSDLLFIRKSPVYNYDVTDWSEVGKWKYEQYENIFGPFASWIVEDGRRRQQEHPQNSAQALPYWAQSGEDIGAVRELMLLMVAYDHFNSKFENGVRESRSGPAYLKKEGNRTVSVVRWGVFQVERITMPAQVEDLETGFLFAEYHPSFEGSVGEYIPYQFDIRWTTNGLLESAPRWQYGGWDWESPGPPPMLELWQFALRRYLNLGFRYKTFWIPRRPMIWECIWWLEVGRGDVFLNPDWAVVQRYQPEIFSWEHEIV